MLHLSKTDLHQNILCSHRGQCHQCRDQEEEDRKYLGNRRDLIRISRKADKGRIDISVQHIPLRLLQFRHFLSGVVQFLFRIGECLMERFPRIVSLHIRIDKENPPTGTQSDTIGVSLTLPQ